ncbi:MAG: hypothetical protein IJS26_03845 [Alphaproteobacteria bacterium]|nr:hypothetical protein [Alphaproteobacteria bacterium]
MDILTDNERQPCEVWSRVMGYHRPVSEYNKGKKAEYYSRLCFKEEKAVKRMQSDTKSAQNEKIAA